MTAIISIIIAYLIGSLSSSIILAKITGQSDPRTQGSGNAGATNVLRTQGKKQAIIVLAGDIIKGVVAVLIGYCLKVSSIALGFVGLAAILGHIFPLFFEFKGGKGVATGLGVICTLSPITGLIALIGWIITAAITRYASLASLVAAAIAPLATFFVGNLHQTLPLFLIAVAIFWKHHANIQRLRNGTESKINL